MYDANGNVGQLVTPDGSIVAHYEYDPFGNAIVAEGSEAGSNVFRFSTKFFDIETGLYYYGFRYYLPELGRWMTRDPIGEIGNVNIYLFCNNISTNYIDLYGLFSNNKIYEELIERTLKSSSEWIAKYGATTAAQRVLKTIAWPLAIILMTYG